MGLKRTIFGLTTLFLVAWALVGCGGGQVSPPVAEQGVGITPTQAPDPSTRATPDDKLPTEKQALVASMAATQIAVTGRTPAPKDDATEIAHATEVAVALQTPWSTPTIVRGIRDIQISPFHSQDAIVENQWQDLVNGEHVKVYAGLITGEPEQGFVAVSTWKAGDKGSTQGKFLPTPIDPTPSLIPLWTGSTPEPIIKYRTPIKAGAVKITSVDGLLFTLTAEDGTTFIFDLASRTFK